MSLRLNWIRLSMAVSKCFTRKIYKTLYFGENRKPITVYEYLYQVFHDPVLKVPFVEQAAQDRLRREGTFTNPLEFTVGPTKKDTEEFVERVGNDCEAILGKKSIDQEIRDSEPGDYTKVIQWANQEWPNYHATSPNGKIKREVLAAFRRAQKETTFTPPFDGDKVLKEAFELAARRLAPYRAAKKKHDNEICEAVFGMTVDEIKKRLEIE